MMYMDNLIVLEDEYPPHPAQFFQTDIWIKSI